MTTNKTKITVLDQKIIEALASTLKTATITLAGDAYKAKDLQAQFQAEVDAVKATEAARTAYQQAVLAEQTVTAEATALRKALRSYLIGTYGATSATVAAFGFAPKEATVTVETKALAIKKRAATRVARGTKGSKQKKAIKGTVPDTSSAAAAAPESPGAPAAPVVNGAAVVNGATPKSTAAS